MRDYQWPDALRPQPHGEVEDPAREAALRAEIEGFFSGRYGVDAVLMPSGRAALHAILEFSGLGRGDTVFAPRWSSACVWDAIGRIANPTISFTPAPQAVLAVHKWGYLHRLRTPPAGLIIEDSVDSLIAGRQGLFPLGGQFELLSLPKLLASHAGGIVLTQRADFAAFVAGQRAERRALGVHQSRLKHRRVLGTLGEFESPELLEPLNRHVDIAGLEDIRARLKNFDTNAGVIHRRVDAVRSHLGADAIDTTAQRLPSVFPAPIARYRADQPDLYLERHFDAARCLDAEHYVVCRLLPLHFGVDDGTFEQLLHGLLPL